MTPELKEYYEAQIKMFAEKGWRDWIEDVRRMEEATNSLDGATCDNLRHKQGELDVFRMILNWEKMVNDAYEQVKAEDASDA